MTKIALSLLALALVGPKPVSPKTATALPKATAPAATKPVQLSPEGKAAVDLAKIQPLPHLDAAKKVKVTIGEIKTIDEQGAYRLTPREPWRAGAYLNFVAANVYVEPPQADMEPFARMRGNTSFSSYFQVSFPVRAGWAYVLDCEVTGATSFAINRGGAGQDPANASGGHLVLGLPRATAAGRATFLVSASRTFSMSACEVIPAK